MAWRNTSARQSHPVLFHPEDEAEKVYRITGTDRSFSSNPVEFDEKAVKELHQINNLKGRDAAELHNDFRDLEPEDIPGDRPFLCQDNLYSLLCGIGAGKWRGHGSAFGYGVGNYRIGLKGFKQSFVYYKGGHKTNCILNVYYTIAEDRMQTDDIFLCHVFQSNGSYDPRPKCNEDQIKDQITRKYFESLEFLLQDPSAFKDFDECHENSGAYSARKANGSKGKRSAVWEDFTEIKVLGPNREVVLTLAICHHCNMAYKTGGLKPNEEDPTNWILIITVQRHWDNTNANAVASASLVILKVFLTKWPTSTQPAAAKCYLLAFSFVGVIISYHEI